MESFTVETDESRVSVKADDYEYLLVPQQHEITVNDDDKKLIVRFKKDRNVKKDIPFDIVKGITADSV